VAVTFFEHQARARRSTSLLVVLFALAVVGVVLAVNLIVPLALYVGARGFIAPSPGLYIGLTVVTLAVIGIRTLVGVLQMRGGGDAVAQLAGGVRVERGTRDADERRLLNVVDEMAIASGVSVPHVYVLRGERGINAFAAGYSPNEAVVAVTEGTARTLTRDELQGVVAHEFSHVLNGDMRLSVQMIGVLAGVLFIGEVGNFLLRARSSGDDRRSARPTTSLPLTLGYSILVQRQISVGQKEFASSGGPNRQIAVSITKRPGIWGINKWFRCSPLQIDDHILKKSEGANFLVGGAVCETDLVFGKKWFKCFP